MEDLRFVNGRPAVWGLESREQIRARDEDCFFSSGSLACGCRFCCFRPLWPILVLLPWLALANGLFFFGPFPPLLGCVFIVFAHFGHCRAGFFIILALFGGPHFDLFGPGWPILGCSLITLAHFPYFWVALV